MVLKYLNVIGRSVVKRMFHNDRRFMASFKNICFENLKQRALLKLSGPDTAKFLQGMVTNDMQVFDHKDSDTMMRTCIYTLLLNSHGRVLYDCLLYKMDENDYILEYDSAASEYMKKHLSMYRLRKDVNVIPVNDVEVWVAYSTNNECSQLRSVMEDSKSNKNIVVAVGDPRIKELGVRFIAKKHTNTKSFFVCSEGGSTQDSYDMFRYELGVGEGVADHPPGVCLPFETNVDFLNGVSFQKGCYMGQELTARVHFTGVIRKRIMPVIISSNNGTLPKLPLESTVVNESGQKLGKLRNHIAKFGLATLNVDECLKSKSLKLKDFDINVTAIKPRWWPIDSNKLKH